MYRTCLTEIHGALQMTVEVYRVELRGQPDFSDSPHHAGRGSAGRGTRGGDGCERRVMRGRLRVLAGARSPTLQALPGARGPIPQALPSARSPLRPLAAPPFGLFPGLGSKTEQVFPQNLPLFGPELCPRGPESFTRGSQPSPRDPEPSPRGILPSPARAHLSPRARIMYAREHPLRNRRHDEQASRAPHLPAPR